MERLSEASFSCEGDTWDAQSSLSLSSHREREVGEPAEAEAAAGSEAATLRRALAAERARAAAAARAQDARLAELHGVIAELVRRRDERDARGIPEEASERSASGSGSDVCESATQPAGDLDRDADCSRTDNTSSLLSGADGVEPRTKAATETSDYIGRSDSLRTSHDTTDLADQCLDSGQGVDVEPRRAAGAARRRRGAVGPPSDQRDTTGYETSLKLSEKELECCRSRVHSCSDRVRSECCQLERDSCCARVSPFLHTPSPGRGGGEATARVAARVRLRRADDAPHVTGREISADQVWSASLVEHLAGEMRAHGELGEALAAATSEASSAALSAAAARAERLAADARVLERSLAAARDTADSLWLTCALHESWSVCLCGALRAADRALETYDVLLALAEAQHDEQRAAAESVALRLLARLDAEAGGAGGVGEPLLSPGPWLDAAPAAAAASEGGWGAACEARLRAHAARLKGETAAARGERPPQPLHTHHHERWEVSGAGGGGQHELEAAVLAAEAAAARDDAAAARAQLAAERARTAALARALAAARSDIQTEPHGTVGRHSARRTRRHAAPPAETNL